MVFMPFNVVPDGSIGKHNFRRFKVQCRTAGDGTFFKAEITPEVAHHKSNTETLKS